MDKRKSAVFGILLGMAICALDWSIVSTALPTIQYKLEASILQLQWIMNIFGILICTFLVTMGRAADLYGRRRFFLIGLIVFGLASLLGGFAQNPLWLIICRGFQGLSAAILYPASQGLIVHAYPDDEKGKALGLWTSVVGIALAMGPVLGGIIVTFDWRWIFFINLPLAFIAYVFVHRFVEEEKGNPGGTKIDIKGVVFLTLGIATVVTSIVQGPGWGWDSPLFILSLLAGLLLLMIFLILEAKSKEPIIGIRCFMNRMFLGAAISNFYLIFFVWAAYFLLPLYLHNILLYPVYIVGLILAFVTVPVAILSHMIGKVVDQKGNAILWISFGFLLFIISSYLMTNFELDRNLTLITCAFLAMGIAWGFMWGPATSVGISALRKEVAALAAGGLATVQEIGAAIGLAICGSLFRYRDESFFDVSLAERGIRIDDAQEILIKSKLSEPESLKKSLSLFPHNLEEIVSVLRDSFLEGFTAVMNLLLILSCVSFIFVFFLLRKKP